MNGHTEVSGNFLSDYAKNGGCSTLEVEKYINSDDPRMNYVFVKPENILKQTPRLPEVIQRDLFDYGIVIKKGEVDTEDTVGTLDTVVPCSYTQIKKEDDGEQWYRDKYPNLPEEFYGIIARYTWGIPFTKKEVRNTTKKIKKGKKDNVPRGFTMVKKSIEIDLS